jgi:hypothetical protein
MVTALIAVSATAAVVAGLRSSRRSRPTYDRLPPGTCPCGRSHASEEPAVLAAAA